MDKVTKRQNWNLFFVGMAEAFMASQAGNSHSTSFEKAQSNSSSISYADGVAIDDNGNFIYGSVYGNSNTYSSIYSTSFTQSYDGYKAYQAQQQALQNYKELEKHQHEERRRLNQGYLKLNTIPRYTEYGGYIIFEVQDEAESVELEIPLLGTIFVFSWDL